MKKDKIRILVLGVSGMLGSSMFRTLSSNSDFEVLGSVRNPLLKKYFDPMLHSALTTHVDLRNETDIKNLLSNTKPSIVVNCVGIIKQLSIANDVIENISINALLPHRLARHCNKINARLINFGTDCVFSGKTGSYTEDDFADADDLYGRTKLLGEVSGENCITLRTSIIGHELNSTNSLINWFLKQSTEVKGFSKAIFSGMPTIEIARIVSEFVITNPNLSGLYHLSAEPINKYDLLKLVAERYNKDVVITPDDKVVIDRSLNSDRFRMATGFRPKPWPELIKIMHNGYLNGQ